MTPTPSASSHSVRFRAILSAGLLGLALALALLGGCATRGITTRALESRPIVQCYERNCSAAEDSRAAAQGGCPSCVY